MLTEILLFIGFIFGFAFIVCFAIFIVYNVYHHIDPSTYTQLPPEYYPYECMRRDDSDRGDVLEKAIQYAKPCNPVELID